MSKDKVMKFIAIFLLFIGLGCMGYYFYEVKSTEASVQGNTDVVSARHIADQVKNKQKEMDNNDPTEDNLYDDVEGDQKENTNKQNTEAPEVTYDTHQVSQITPRAIREVNEKMKNPWYREAVKENALGALSIPESGLSITVLNGLSETNLVSGAGTFWAEQRMGVNNYPLASHNVNNEDLLLGPLFRTKPGMKAYLTDFNKIYVYQMESIALYKPNRSDLIDLNKETPTLTLVTCASFDDISERCIGVGKLVDTMDYDSAPVWIKDSYQ
ncbi:MULTISPECIES: class A sortase [Aerococcus]|uniref:class A sortase n=1 Tax=Aerococcus TaxID=1375 RepID=UPI0018A75F78|nr:MULTISPECIES: class A sortase [Aerococcus]MCY3067592.1 class A sortase [Aerococcus mictus]MCY3080873.1 class A sortase [Aerococcus mictus]MDK8485478.1 class A sortase [Aerococcus urinae]